MKPTLQVRLSQHLTLTPQLQQSIRLLQLSTVELNQEIERLLMENPILEREDGESDAAGAGQPAGQAREAPAGTSADETSGGNPFFAQEIGRALLRRGGEVAAGERPPIPERLQELVEDRLEGLPAQTLEALEVVSALSTPTLDAIAAGTDPSEVDRRLDPALENGVIEVVGDRLRFTHPLLASSVYQRIPPARRRELHARLATIEHLSYKPKGDGGRSGWNCSTIVDGEAMSKEDALFIARGYAVEHNVPVIYECHGE